MAPLDHHTGPLHHRKYPSSPRNGRWRRSDGILTLEKGEEQDEHDRHELQQPQHGRPLLLVRPVAAALPPVAVVLPAVVLPAVPVPAVVVVPLRCKQAQQTSGVQVRWGSSGRPKHQHISVRGQS